MQQQTPQRRTITIDLPLDQITWLDQQARAVMSRSAFVRQLIAHAMQQQVQQ